MLLFTRCLTVAALLLSHSACLIILRHPCESYADLWFYYVLLFAAIPLAVWSGGFYLFWFIKNKLSLNSHWPDLVFNLLFIFQNLSILAVLQQWW